MAKRGVGRDAIVGARPPLGGHVSQRASVDDGLKPYLSAQRGSNKQNHHRCVGFSWTILCIGLGGVTAVKRNLSSSSEESSSSSHDILAIWSRRILDRRNRIHQIADFAMPMPMALRSAISVANRFARPRYDSQLPTERRRAVSTVLSTLPASNCPPAGICRPRCILRGLACGGGGGCGRMMWRPASRQ